MSKFYDTMQLKIAIFHMRDSKPLQKHLHLIAFTFKHYIHDSKSLKVLRKLCEFM